VAVWVALLVPDFADLAAVVSGWNNLSQAVKAGIMAMVQAVMRWSR